MTPTRTDIDGVLTIVIPGKPIGKPTWQKSDKWKPRKCIIDYRAFCDYLRLIAKPIPVAGSVQILDVVAYFNPPPSWSARKRAAMLGELHRLKPDADNILKAVDDALWSRSKAVATAGRGDDSAIARANVSKWWARESYLWIQITHGGK